VSGVAEAEHLCPTFGGTGTSMLDIGRAYGQSSNLFASRKPGGETMIIGGVAEDASRFTRVVSQRAAQMLWFHLTRYLFPERSDVVTALATTAPMRSPMLPTLTTHIGINLVNGGMIEITGWIGERCWLLRITELEARRFWQSLDLALYPVGWQGGVSAKE